MSLVATLNSGVSALSSFAEGIQVISNNISNVNTTGFKGSRAGYADSFSNILRQAAPAPASGTGSNTPATQIGTGVRVGSVAANFEQGTLTSTGKNTDLAIAGQGQVIVLRILATQRQFEAILAVLIPVTRPLVATRLGKHRHHVVAKAHRLLAPGTVRRQGQDSQEQGGTIHGNHV